MPRKLVCALAVLLVLPLSGGEAAAFFGSAKKGVLSKKERAMAEEILAGLQAEARLLFFAKESDCKECRKIRSLVIELSGISEMIDYEVIDFDKGSQRAATFALERAPALIILGKEGKDYGIRYFGLPLGYEFEEFLRAVVKAAHGTTGLEPQTEAGLELLENPVTVTVFVARH